MNTETVILTGSDEALEAAMEAETALVVDHIITSFTSREPYAGSENRTSNPRFVAPAKGNFTLRGGSLCVNTGANQPYMTGAKDLAGNPRLVGNVADRGCYERQ